MTVGARHRVQRRSRQGRRGQVMAIFALVAVVLFAIAGLGVDAAMSYLTANAVERAAAAGALAGVTYMPNGCSPSCMSGSAGAAALDATARNGFANGATVNGEPVSVSVARYPAGCSGSACDPNKLSVSVSAWVPSTFLSLIGFGEHRVVSTETAYYLPPLTLGQPGPELGSGVSGLQSGQGYYLLRTEGWATDRGNGDAYTPNPADPGDPVLSSATDVHALSEAKGTDFGETGSAHPLPIGFNPLPDQGGYNFQVTVPAGINDAQLQVYNPAFAPDRCTGAGSQCYHEDDSIAPSDHQQYSVMEYTLFQVNDVYDHLGDTPIAQVVVDPIDATTCPLAGTQASPSTCDAGGAMSYATNAVTGGTLTKQSFTDYYHNWVAIFDPADVGADSTGKDLVTFTGGSPFPYLSPGTTYRLRVDTLDDQGQDPAIDAERSCTFGSVSETCSAAHKGYAVEVTENGTGDGLCDTCTVGGIDDLAVYTPFTLGSGQTAGSFDIPLVNISRDYAGLTVDFYVYDPGDLFGYSSNLLSVVDPDTDQPVPPDTLAGQSSVPIYNLGPSLGTPLSSAYAIPPSNGDGTGQRPDANATLQTLWCSGNSTQHGQNGGQSKDDCYNGEWLLYQITIPGDYTGATACTGDPICGTYWGLRYNVRGSGSANDTFTMVVSFDGTPVHLLP
jgi:hypothetical protein